MAADLLERMKLFDRIMCDSATTPAERAAAWALLWGFYNRESGRCDPSAATIAARAGADHRNIRRALQRLSQRGYFRIGVLQGSGSTHGPTNVYKPVFDAPANPGQPRPPMASMPPLEPRAPTPPEGKNSTEPRAPTPSKPSIEPRERTAPSPLPFSANGFHVPMAAKKTSVIKKPTRDKSLYLAKHGCTIDSYQPDPVTMSKWAAEKAPLIKDPVSDNTVEDIKDQWRRRGEKPRDFDATYRTYLRKRQEWAAERSAAHEPRSRVGMV